MRLEKPGAESKEAASESRLQKSLRWHGSEGGQSGKQSAALGRKGTPRDSLELGCPNTAAPVPRGYL